MTHVLREACPVCSGAHLRQLPGYSHASLTRCRGCGLTFSDRLPSDSELSEHYDDYGHAWFDSPITRIRYRELLTSFDRYRKTNRLFDLGCGAGFFLDEARSAGWEVYGNEFSQHAIKMARAKGLDVLEGAITHDAFPPGTFDVVTAFEVFEHLRDPTEVSNIIAHLLRPGGLLYCTTPNFNALSRRLLRARWSVIEYPEHLVYYTPRTIKRWLERDGFAVNRVTTSGLSFARLRAGMPVPSETSSYGDEGLREAAERSRALGYAKRSVNLGLGLLGAGDTLKAWFTLSSPS
jgi:2-polyprenyl-3-methyl-5-hydroxy-6-metoxy-1,4-benzoquinol methylase